MASKTALVAGATGLVGGYLVDYLLGDSSYTEVKVLTRREPNRAHPRLKTLLVDFDQLSQESELLKADHVFCCLGTTMGKAGSQEQFKKVDYTYPLELARAALAQGASTFVLVSAVGADSSSLFFYNKVKGELEEALAGLGFARLLIFRPSLLLGTRKETRIAEDIGKMVMEVLNPVMLGPFRRYRGIPAQAVAFAMWQAANEEGHAGVCFFESEEIEASFEYPEQG